MSSFIFKLATTPEELEAYFRLRHSIFVQEQGLFLTHDLDEHDQVAYPIIALEQESPILDVNPEVLGVVRIYEPEPGLWYGGRLGVHPEYRRAGRIGKGLIYKAVTTATTWGCHQFLATVQLQNVRFFQRFHWTSQQEIELCGSAHHLMEADLAHYPPGRELRRDPPCWIPRAS